MLFKNDYHGLVSIIIPCFNHGLFLSEAILSVLNSTYSPLEIIVVDDGSIDDSREVAIKFREGHANIHYVYQENRGPSAARNLGIRISRGEYILPLDADDKISKDYIEKAVQILKENNEIKVVYCNAEFFGAKTGSWKLYELSLHRLALRNMIYNSALFRRSDYDKTGGYDERLIYGHEDWEFWISMLKDGAYAYKLENTTGFFYRIHQHSRRRTTARKFKNQSLNIINGKHQSFFMKQLKGPVRNHSKLTIPINYIINIAKFLFFIFTSDL